MNIKKDIDMGIFGNIGYVRRREDKWYGCYKPGKIKSDAFNTEAEAEHWLHKRDHEAINYAAANLEK